MTEQQYLQQNAKGFEGDGFLRATVEELIKKHEIEAIFETGTYMGATTRQFAKMAPEVYTCEVNLDFFKTASEVLRGIDNIKMTWQGSQYYLQEVLPKHKEKKLFFFLDAHWGENNPLLEELRIIAENGIKPVIAIHDFKVPGKPELGYDVYGPIVYEWDYIAESIETIYGKEYTITYNSEAEGARRGVIFIEPK